MRQKISTHLSRHNTLYTFLLNVTISIVYIVSGKLGLSLAYLNPSATAIWAPTGIALAAILIFGYRIVPAIFFGAFFVNLTTAGNISTSLGIALGNTLEGIIGAYLVKQLANGEHAFDSVADIFKFTFFAAILSTTVSANIGAVTLILGGLATWHTFLPIWTTWWLGDMGGALVIAPLILIWKTHPRVEVTLNGIFRLLLSFLILLLMTEIVFSGIIPYPYLCIPIVVWIAFWFGRKGAAVSTIFVAFIAIFYTLHGFGPFATAHSLNQSLILIQTFVSIYSLTGLIFATAIRTSRKSEKNLTYHEERFKALIEKSFDAVVLIDATSKISYASPSVKRLLGYDSDELQGTIGFDLVAPEDRNMTMHELAKLVLKPGGTVTVQYRTIRKDKKIIWVEAVGTNLLLEPNVNAVVVNFHDITKEKQIQEKLREEKLEDKAMLTSIGEGIIATDNLGKITLVNHTTCEILQCEEKDLIGNSIIIAIPMQDEAGKELPISERPMTKVLTLKKRIVTSSDVYYLRKDGTNLPVHVTVTPIILDKKVVGMIEVFQDITKEKEVDKAKSEFVSVASHQLRTPLATINWYLESLLKQKDSFNEKQASYLQEVYLASKRMVNLINALLNASRLELGTFAVEPVQMYFVPIIRQVIEEQKQQIKGKNITIKENYQEKLPMTNIDAKLFTIIMQNLLSNAIKYSHEDSTITITVTYNKKEFLISIDDSGFGIPANQQAKIFTRMFRADNARSLEPDGTGLGLYIVKAIVDTTGGKIWFTSEENKGTTFYISFPDSGMQQKSGTTQLHS